MIEHKNLSLHLSKEQLKRMVHELAAQHYLIFWGFDRGTMILNVYQAAANNQFTFIRHRDTMELIYAKIADRNVLAHVNESIPFSAWIDRLQREREAVTKRMRYRELDYYLGVLHDYMLEENKEKMAETKAILASLTSDAL
ncbi:hypothetical protein [Domibacillus robiginosus]|uniref:hypothetical protein n=1 Tax=Domibacillus robiginosus TaxID=1071054 RepID=UPI00067E3E68|nr:hypothetical protein [Domibacillus robiginosus]